MKPEKVREIFQKIKNTRPLIHMIPNGVSAELCADGLSALGARPLMALAPEEMTEIAAQSDGIVVNLGQLTREKEEAAKLVLKEAQRLGRPVVLDPVGCGASLFRLKSVQRLLSLPWDGIVKGNVSELYSIQKGILTKEGVDAVKERAIKDICPSRRVYLATGACDWVLTGEGRIALPKKEIRSYNIVGTGCLLGAIAGACYSSEADSGQAAQAAALGMAYALEQAGLEQGYGNAKTTILNALGDLTEDGFLTWMRGK